MSHKDCGDDEGGEEEQVVRVCCQLLEITMFEILRMETYSKRGWSPCWVCVDLSHSVDHTLNAKKHEIQTE